MVPVPLGDPLPVVAMIMPAESPDPVSRVQERDVPPPLLNVQLGVLPATMIRPVPSFKCWPEDGVMTKLPEESSWEVAKSCELDERDLNCTGAESQVPVPQRAPKTAAKLPTFPLSM